MEKLLRSKIVITDPLKNAPPYSPFTKEPETGANPQQLTPRL